MPSIGAESPGSAAEFVLPDSARRLIEPVELLDLSREQLRQARNELYARKGYRFQTRAAREFFESYSYYRPHLDRVELDATERRNLALIQRFEGFYAEVPEGGFEAAYEIISGPEDRDIEAVVRKCARSDCEPVGALRPGCAVLSDIRLTDIDYVYVRSSQCGDDSGPENGWVEAARAQLVGG